ncbi:MAG: hypothetical protein AABX31_03365 [Nanoarchaeota archaeon]
MNGKWLFLCLTIVLLLLVGCEQSPLPKTETIPVTETPPEPEVQAVPEPEQIEEPVGCEYNSDCEQGLLCINKECKV